MIGRMIRMIRTIGRMTRMIVRMVRMIGRMIRMTGGFGGRNPLRGPLKGFGVLPPPEKCPRDA